MVDNFESTADEIASRLAINKGTVISRINLLKSIPKPVLDAWKQYRITWGHVQLILSLETEHEQLELMQEVLARRYNVV